LASPAWCRARAGLRWGASPTGETKTFCQQAGKYTDPLNARKKALLG